MVNMSVVKHSSKVFLIVALSPIFSSYVVLQEFSVILSAVDAQLLEHFGNS